MTDVVIAAEDTGAVATQKPARPEEQGVDAQLVAQLVEQARTAGLQLTGEGGLLQQLTKRGDEHRVGKPTTDPAAATRYPRFESCSNEPTTRRPPRSVCTSTLRPTTSRLRSSDSKL
jgi:hypothetical protein